MEQLLAACQNMGQDRWWFAVEDQSANSFMTAEHFLNEKPDIFDSKVWHLSNIEVIIDVKDWKSDVRLRDGWSNVDHIALTWYYFGDLETPTRRMEINFQGRWMWRNKIIYIMCGLMLWNSIKKYVGEQICCISLTHMMEIFDYTAFLHVTVNCQWLHEISRCGVRNSANLLLQYLWEPSCLYWNAWYVCLLYSYLFNFAIHCVNIFFMIFILFTILHLFLAFTENILSLSTEYHLIH